jgi:hypothetical protein
MNPQQQQQQPLRDDDPLPNPLPERRNHHQLLQLQDLDGWLESNGLHSGTSSSQGNTINDDTTNISATALTLPEIEERQRVQEETSYAQSIYEAAFHNEIQREQSEQEQKQNVIATWKGRTMSFITAAYHPSSSLPSSSSSSLQSGNNNNKDVVNQNHHNDNRNDDDKDVTTTAIISNVPIEYMAQFCDFIYTMIQHQSLWKTKHSDDDDDDDDDIDDDTDDDDCYQVSLQSYSKCTVQIFINICRALYNPYPILHGHWLQDEANVTRERDTNRRSSNSNNHSHHETYAKLKNDKLLMQDIISTQLFIAPKYMNIDSNDFEAVHTSITVVLMDCCRIAHYLLAPLIVNEITQLLMSRINTQNCVAIYYLATELQLSSSTLVERALSHMIRSIGECGTATTEKPKRFNEGQVDDGNDINDTANAELKERLLIMKRAMESSIHSNAHHPNNNNNRKNSGTKSLYFSSMEEYLSIFAERVQYYRERLHDAKLSQKQRSEQVQQNKGNYDYGIKRDTTLLSSSSSYRDAEQKIQKQEQRVQTLEIAYAEQVALFRNNHT